MAKRMKGSHHRHLKRTFTPYFPLCPAGLENHIINICALRHYKIWLILDDLLPNHLMIHMPLDDQVYPAEDASVMWENLPGYGNGAREENRHLTEWFCGWALTQTKRYRRFVIVDAVAGEELRFSEAVDLVTPDQFFAAYT